MEIQYVYQKKRSEFGRQCLFTDKGPELIDNFASNKEMLQRYIQRDPVSQGTQCSAVQAEHDVNTIRVEYTNTGINHTEGGWPKDINIHDEEQTKRHRRKVEKDDNYNPVVMGLCRTMEKSILQNNAINIYQQYFSDVEPLPLQEKCSARTLNVFQDQSIPTRPVTHCSWSPDEGTKIAVSHCNLKFQASVPNETTHSYIWETENPNRPLLVMKPPSPAICLEYNQKDPNSLVSGHINGKVAVWDIRRGSEPVEMCMPEVGHRDPVHNVLWIQSKSGNEFFSSSTDGQLKWWDTRKINNPLETLILDYCRAEDQTLAKAMGASCLEYEPTIPTRFMVGTEQGTVISGNRKGKTPIEKMVGRYQAHFGPVLALHRNTAFVKNFLTVGDWSCRIWSEDCKESPIMWTNYHRPMLTAGAWSPARFSVFYTTRTDGILDVWDVIIQQKQAILGVKVCDEPLRCLRAHDGGQLVAVGNQKGNVYLVQFNESLATNNKNDKMLLTAMFEREAKREKILEARNREIRLKQRLVSDQGAEGEEAKEAMGGELAKAASAKFFEDPMVIQAEQEFFQVIDFETKGPEIQPEADLEPELDTEPEPLPPAPTPQETTKIGKKKK